MPTINGPDELARFREHWTGEKMLELVQQHNGSLLIDWAIGVGKSSNIDQTTEAAIQTGNYDLVVALFPTRRIINERQWVMRPPADIRIINLEPRPQIRCGPHLNRTWRVFEKNGLGALGRMELCGHCLLKKDCRWPTQFGKTLKGVQVIIGTQAHLERSPSFIEQIIQWTEAGRVLVLLDEVNFIMKPFRRCIANQHLRFFLDALLRLNPSKWGKSHQRWQYLTELLVQARTKDMRCHEWLMPWITFDWSVAVQSCGHKIYGDSFHFPAFDLVHFGRSPLESRERANNGDILYAIGPNVKGDFIIYSGAAYNGFSQFRMGLEFTSPFEEYRFEHPETVWYNIASRLGAKSYFLKNSAQVLDFIAGLVARRMRNGKRPLLVAKKCFVPFCAHEIQKRLRAMGVAEASVIITGWRKDLLANPLVVPLIHFGMIGNNLFEDFDCAYCLTGYCVTEEAVNGILQDVMASDMKVPLRVTIEGKPWRRRVGVLHSKDRFYDVHGLAQHALDHLEMGTVLQAVGRVRPYSRSREIITFQCADHPHFQYTREFSSIGEAREYFGIEGKRSAMAKKTIATVQLAKEKGLKQKEVAERLGISVRTVKRYWNAANMIKGATNPK
jgi:hypothetical protein